MQALGGKWRTVGGECRMSRRKSAFGGASLPKQARGGSQLKATGLAGSGRHGPGFSRVRFHLHCVRRYRRVVGLVAITVQPQSWSELPASQGDQLRNALARAAVSPALCRAYGPLL